VGQFEYGINDILKKKKSLDCRGFLSGTGYPLLIEGGRSNDQSFLRPYLPCPSLGRQTCSAYTDQARLLYKLVVLELSGCTPLGHCTDGISHTAWQIGVCIKSLISIITSVFRVTPDIPYDSLRIHKVRF